MAAAQGIQDDQASAHRRPTVRDADQVETDCSNRTHVDVIAAPLSRAKLVVVGNIAAVSGDLSLQALLILSEDAESPTLGDVQRTAIHWHGKRIQLSKALVFSLYRHRLL